MKSLHLQRCGSLPKAEFLEPNHTIFGGDIASSIMMMDTLIKLQSAEFGDLTVSFFILFYLNQRIFMRRESFEELRLTLAKVGKVFFDIYYAG